MAVASISLRLGKLSESFIADASNFLDACQTSWEWPNLTSIVLTSQLLTPRESPTKINDMLLAAATAGEKMPKLKTMELWNGYRSGNGNGSSEPAVVTCRGTWELVLQLLVTQAWEAVAVKYLGPLFTKELLSDAISIKSHGDAILQLELSESGSVIRPVSLQQIQMEHQVLEGV
ncbi:hypothetical protein NW762_003506 [Fusarium torreyae]|uniref:DUF6546 domain-containing protein n=1 Tax=Fusarium torreyae TaxID=1237075 RepID=A0A9W8S8N1_9HYPO|nr:hypothetical protein NW762_003506 [Fusarium torreyae]